MVDHARAEREWNGISRAKLREADDALARQVADVRDADERQQVVLADDELVVAAVVGEGWG